MNVQTMNVMLYLNLFVGLATILDFDFTFFSHMNEMLVSGKME